MTSPSPSSYSENPRRGRCTCGNLVRNKGRAGDGNTRYGIECHGCHRKAEPSYKYALDNSRCTLCGWDKAPCDRHRIDPVKGYVSDNVVPLCPNCHRLVTFGLISLDGAMLPSHEVEP